MNKIAVGDWRKDSTGPMQVVSGAIGKEKVHFQAPAASTLENEMCDFIGKLTTSKWSKIEKCSSDTALRDIQDLLNKGILIKESAGGRSTNYRLTELVPS